MLNIRTLIVLKSGRKSQSFTMKTKNIIILLLLALQLASAAGPFERINTERNQNGISSIEFAPTVEPISMTDKEREQNGLRPTELFDQSGDKSWATKFTDDGLIIYVSTDNFNGPISAQEITEEERDQHRFETAVSVIQKTNEMRLPLKSGSSSIFCDNTLNQKAIIFKFAFEDWFDKLKNFWIQLGKQLAIESGFAYQVDKNLQNMLDKYNMSTELVDADTYFFATHSVLNEPLHKGNYMTPAMIGILAKADYKARLLLPITLGAYIEIEDNEMWKCIFVFKIQSEVDILNNFIKGHLGALAHELVEKDILKGKATAMLTQTTVDTTQPNETTTDKTYIHHDKEYVHISTEVDISGLDDIEKFKKTAAIVQAIENIKLKAGTKLLGGFSVVGIADKTETNVLKMAVVLKYLTETDLLTEQEIKSSPVRGGLPSPNLLNAILPTALYEDDPVRNPARVVFSDVDAYKQFITLVGCIFQQVISRLYFNSISDFRGFYDYYKTKIEAGKDEVEKDTFEQIFREYKPTIQARQHTCVGLAYELRNRVNSFLTPDHSAFEQLYIVSSADEKPMDTGSVPSDSKPGLITHVLLCLKVMIGDRAGFMLLDPGYPVPLVLTVMGDQKFPHTGRFENKQDISLTKRLEYEYAMVDEDYITLKSITTEIVKDKNGKEVDGIQTIETCHIWHKEPFKNGTDIAQRLLLPRSPKKLMRFDMQGRYVAGVYFDFTGTSMFYNMDRQRQWFKLDLKNLSKATTGKDKKEVDGFYHIKECGEHIGLEPGELLEMMETIGKVMENTKFVEELKNLEKKIDEANKN